MTEKETTDLLNIFENISVENMDTFIRENGKEMRGANIFLEYMLKNKVTPAMIVNHCKGHISKSYIHDLLNGKKCNPSRDIVLILCLAANMNKKEVRRVLENYNHRDLYIKDKRDIIIATYINNEIFDIDKINDELEAYSLALLNE